MPSIDIKPSGSPRRRSSFLLRIALLASIALGAVAIGSTLAANINLNSGGPVEFGQGVARAVACDSSVLVTPFSVFRNQQGGGGFKLGSIKVSGIADACSGRNFILKAYSNGNPSPMDLYTAYDSTIYNQITVAFDGSSFVKVFSGLGYDDLSYSTSLDNNEFTINMVTSDLPPNSLLANASEISRITIETQVGDSVPPITTYSCDRPFFDANLPNILVKASDLPITFYFTNCSFYYESDSNNSRGGDGSYGVQAISPTTPYIRTLGNNDAGTPAPNQQVDVTGSGRIFIYTPGRGMYDWRFTVIP